MQRQAAAMWLRSSTSPRSSTTARSPRRTPSSGSRTDAPLRPAVLLVLRSSRSRAARVGRIVDRFGNTVHHFDVLESAFDAVGVTARSEVWTAAQLAPTRSGAVAARPLGSSSRPSRYVPLERRASAISPRRPRRRRRLRRTRRPLRRHGARSAHGNDVRSAAPPTRRDDSPSEALAARAQRLSQDFAHVMIGRLPL